MNDVSFIVTDINSQADIDNLVGKVKNEYGGLDILINNAGQAYFYKLMDGGNIAKKAAHEMQTNYLAPINLIKNFLPLLIESKEAAIVNVTSIVAFVPGINMPGYAASKAALHSYTQALRLILSKSNTIKVFELMPPLVNTEFSAEIGGANGIPPEEVAQGLINGFDKDEFEIHIGKTADIYKLFLQSPQAALVALNQGRE